MKRLTLISMASLLLCGGCSVLNWDMNHQESIRKGPGAEAKGEWAKVEYKKDGTISASASKYKDIDGNEHPGEVEVRKGSHAESKAWASDFDLLRFGSQKELDVETSINKKGEVNAGTSQEPHGFTILEWVLIGAAVVFGPLLLGGILCAFFPTGALHVLGLSLLKLNVFTLIGKLISKKTPVEDESSNGDSSTDS